MHRKAAVLTALLATMIAVAACGGTSPSTTNGQTASRLTAHTNVGLKLAQCMRSHGVLDYPDPTSSGNFQVSQSGSSSGSSSISVNGHTINVSGPAFQHAMAKCRSLMPQGPAISGAQLAQIKQGAMKMARCMRSHGVPSFPDPKVAAGPGGRGIQVQIGGPPGSAGTPRAMNPRSPAFQKAQQSCQHFMGGPAGPGTVRVK